MILAEKHVQPEGQVCVCVSVEGQMGVCVCVIAEQQSLHHDERQQQHLCGSEDQG